MNKYVLILCLLLCGCEDCSKPTKSICIKNICYPLMIYNAATKSMMPITSCHCVEYKEVPNECYKEQTDELI